MTGIVYSLDERGQQLALSISASKGGRIEPATTLRTLGVDLIRDYHVHGVAGIDYMIDRLEKAKPHQKGDLLKGLFWALQTDPSGRLRLPEEQELRLLGGVKKLLDGVTDYSFIHKQLVDNLTGLHTVTWAMAKYMTQRVEQTMQNSLALQVFSQLVDASLGAMKSFSEGKILDRKESSFGARYPFDVVAHNLLNVSVQAPAYRIGSADPALPRVYDARAEDLLELAGRYEASVPRHNPRSGTVDIAKGEADRARNALKVIHKIACIL